MSGTGDIVNGVVQAMTIAEDGRVYDVIELVDRHEQNDALPAITAARYHAVSYADTVGMPIGSLSGEEPSGWSD